MIARAAVQARDVMYGHYADQAFGRYSTLCDEDRFEPATPLERRFEGGCAVIRGGSPWQKNVVVRGFLVTHHFCNGFSFHDTLVDFEIRRQPTGNGLGSQ